MDCILGELDPELRIRLQGSDTKFYHLHDVHFVHIIRLLIREMVLTTSYTYTLPYDNGSNFFGCLLHMLGFYSASSF